MTKESIPKLVYLGCGHHRMPGFIHVEINIGKNKSGPPDVLADITEPMPFRDNSIDLVFSVATMEHLTYQEFINCLLESHRILKKGGCVRMVVPDLDKLVQDYLHKVHKPIKNPGMPNENYVDTFISRFMYFDHRYNHNFDTLSRALEKTGFENIRLCQPGDSKINEANKELFEAEKSREEDDIIVEAEKVHKKPTIEKFPSSYPKNPIANFLARFMNVRISHYTERRPGFPQRSWLKELFLKLKQRKKHF